MTDKTDRHDRKPQVLDATPTAEGWQVLPEGWHLVEDDGRSRAVALRRPARERDEIPAGTFRGGDRVR